MKAEQERKPTIDLKPEVRGIGELPPDLDLTKPIEIVLPPPVRPNGGQLPNPQSVPVGKPSLTIEIVEHRTRTIAERRTLCLSIPDGVSEQWVKAHLDDIYECLDLDDEWTTEDDGAVIEAGETEITGSEADIDATLTADDILELEDA